MWGPPNRLITLSHDISPNRLIPAPRILISNDIQPNPGPQNPSPHGFINCGQTAFVALTMEQDTHKKFDASMPPKRDAYDKAQASQRYSRVALLPSRSGRRPPCRPSSYIIHGQVDASKLIGYWPLTWNAGMVYIWGVGAARGLGDVELMPCFCTLPGD